MPDSRPQTEPDELTGLKSLGRRITRRTFDLTAFAIVTVGLITIAVRLSSWWQTDDSVAANTPGVNAQSQTPWGIGEGGAWLSFGGATWSARHMTLMGLADEVRQQMVDDCRQRLVEGADTTSLPEPTAEENDLIARLSALTPLASADDKAWHVYALEGPLLAVFGVVDSSAAEGMNSKRIACWGIALPAGEALVEPANADAGNSRSNRLPLWSAWMIDPGGSAGVASTRGPVVPCPDGASRVLSIRDPLAGGIDAIHGLGSIDEWRSFYTDWMRGLGTSESSWSSAAGRSQTAAIIKQAGVSWRCDVLLSEPLTGEVECVVNLVEIATP